jgi:uncharacterized coiled-coil protein SlyX
VVHARARDDPQPPRRERGLGTAPAPDWSAIDQRIAAALAQQAKRVAALEERIALLDECSHELAQAVADTFDTIDKALERLESLYRQRAIVSEVIDGGSQLRRDRAT